MLTHAGLLLTIAKDAAYHVDLGPHDRLCWVTDLGWIMGAWEIVAAGSLGAYACMIEGAPATPPDRIWKLIDEHDDLGRGRQPEPDPRARRGRR